MASSEPSADRSHGTEFFELDSVPDGAQVALPASEAGDSAHAATADEWLDTLLAEELAKRATAAAQASSGFERAAAPLLLHGHAAGGDIWPPLSQVPFGAAELPEWPQVQAPPQALEDAAGFDARPAQH